MERQRYQIATFWGSDVEAPEEHREVAARCHPAVARHVREELLGIELAAEPLDVDLVLLQRRDPLGERLTDVDEVGGRIARGDVSRADPLPRLPELREQPAVVGVAARVERGEPDRRDGRRGSRRRPRPR